VEAQPLDCRHRRNATFHGLVTQARPREPPGPHTVRVSRRRTSS
jgi:hypothetical protein